MSTQITITLPDEVYQRAERFARLANRDVASVLADTIQLSIPSVSSEAAALEPLSALHDEHEKNVKVQQSLSVDSLKQIYVFKNSIEIENFVNKHNFLIDILWKTYKEIKKVFGDKCLEVSLEYYADIEENFEGLFAVVHTCLDSEKSLDMLDKFDEEWFLDNIDSDTALIFSVTVRSI